MLTGTVSVVAIGGVAATQYDAAGGTEWGGRYFAIIVPLVVLLAVVFLKERLSKVSVSTQRFVIVSLVSCSCIISIIGIGAVRAAHNAGFELRAEIIERSTQIIPGDAQKPVVLSTVGLPARLSWREYADRRWLLVQKNDLVSTSARLQVLGIKNLTIVVPNSSQNERIVGKGFQLADKRTVLGWAIYTATPKISYGR